ncbi:hypothetical protein B0H17DRAFT_148716 [Mycena rosella]|uniref:TEA domain-containing protein n=1 Tax=Mycena rosella TaxID=1033263 RepID=A0AAD7D3K1_MYCRO|nr:hypothetical protein B0H17DRAFT_148716 [Mycena rosella]
MYWTNDRESTEDTASTGSSTPPTPSADRLYAPISGPAWPTLQSQTTKDVLQSVLKVRKSWKTLRGGETVWPLDLEAALLEGLENYQPDDSRETRMLGRFPRRNRFISDYIFEKTGKRRSAKQVGSRLQQLRESCGGQQLLHLLSPFRQPAYPESSSSGDSPCTSPVSPSMGGRAFPGASSARHTVMYIDIVPEDSPDDVDANSPTLWWSDAGDVVHASDRPRRLRSINPTVTFMSQSPVAAQSRFTVYSESLVLHTETASLTPVTDPAPRVSGFLYSTTLVPQYWKVISESPDPTRFTIYQEVIKDDTPAVIFSVTYKFSYSDRHSPGFPSSLDTLHSSNTRSGIDSLVSAAPMDSQFPGHRYPLYVSPGGMLSTRGKILPCKDTTVQVATLRPASLRSCQIMYYKTPCGDAQLFI